MKTKTCKQCGKAFNQYVTIDGKALNLSKRSYCLECSPYGEYKKNKAIIVDGKRQCIKCKDFKPLKEFQLRTGSRHFRSCCSPCEVERVREYGQMNKERSIAYLGGCCSKCGYNKSPRALHFHHIDPSKKSFNLGMRKCLSWEKTKAELDKCRLVCANCHAELHDRLTEQLQP